MKIPWSDIRAVLQLKNVLYMATWSVVSLVIDGLSGVLRSAFRRWWSRGGRGSIRPATER